MVPHNPLSPVSTAACQQIAACIPNFAIQEYPSRTPELAGGTALLGNDLATRLSEQEVGFINIPDASGIGVGLIPDAERWVPLSATTDTNAATRRWVRGRHVRSLLAR
jgi:galactonate dehydratase